MTRTVRRLWSFFFAAIGDKIRDQAMNITPVLRPEAMLKRFAVFLAIAASLAGQAPATRNQPVFIVLYSRFYDHGNQYPNNERIQLLLPLLDKLRSKYPDSGISGLFEFSGSISQVLFEKNSGLHLVDKVKDAAQRGLIDIGYTGEDEPSYLYRPKPALVGADTAEKRWLAQAEAAEHFLNDFKDPVTGQPVDAPGLSGGLKRMQEVFGPAAFVRGATETLGGDSPVTHQVRKLAPTAMLMGVPPSDTRRGIESYGSSANEFALAISPAPNTPPEVFWEDGALRLSDLSKTDSKPHSTDETVDALKKVFDKLDRTKVRVIALEFGTYRRYLTKRPDGSVLWDPMEWMYYHPDHPQFPLTMKPFVGNRDVMAAYRNEEAVLNWLLQDFMPANTGSRFLSVRDLQKMAGPEAPAEVSWDQIKSLATDFDARFKAHPQRTSDYLRAGDQFFSNAEAFELMAEELAAVQKTGSPLPSVKTVPMYGPVSVPNDMGPIKGSVTVRDVLQAAARIAPGLRNAEWKAIPDNAVPAYIETGAMRLNSAQFLRLMAWALVDPSPDRVLTLSPIEAHSDLTFRYPRNTPMVDQGMGWTFKPAALQYASPGASAPGQ
jgi:hypothetical protein